MWRGVSFSCALYLQEEERGSRLHAAPTVTSLHGESSCQRGFLSPAPPSLSHSLLDLLCGVVKHFSEQATIFKNTPQKTSARLSRSQLPGGRLNRTPTRLLRELGDLNIHPGLKNTNLGLA